MYQARIGANTRASANGICKTIQSAGVALRNTKVKIQE
jgi:hypothetical protein